VLFAGSSFSDGGPARLQRMAKVPYQDRQVVEGVDVDSTPVWEFIDPSLDSATSDVPEQCEASVFTDALDDVSTLPPAVATHLASQSVEVRMEKLVDRCISLYRTGRWNDNGALSPAETRVGCSAAVGSACTGVLFGRNSVVQFPEIYDIQLSPRFGYVPLAWETLGSNVISFQRFRPVFIQRLCLGNQQCNQGTFSPGVPWSDEHTSTVNTDVAAVSAFTFSASMLPNGLGHDDAPFDVGRNVFVRLLR
jgi:hypothetical protein